MVRWVGSCAAGTTAASDRSRGRATQPASNPRLVSLNAVQFNCTAGKTNDGTEGSTAAEADSESGSSLPTDFAKQTISGQRDGQRKVRGKVQFAKARKCIRRRRTRVRPRLGLLSCDVCFGLCIVEQPDRFFKAFT